MRWKEKGSIYISVFASLIFELLNISYHITALRENLSDFMDQCRKKIYLSLRLLSDI